MNFIKKRKGIQCILCAILVVLLAAVFGNTDGRPDSVCINEICSWNEYAVSDEDHNCDDYIELYNCSGEPVSLSGWHLSDDKDDLEKSALPETELAPRERLLFYATGEASADSVAFGINKKGEILFLSDEQGNLVDYVEIPALEANTVYARVSDGASDWGYYTPTPLAANEEAQKVREKKLEEPVFSAGSGFYEEEFCLTMTAARGETVYYTTDGSIPTTDSEVYTEPIEIRDRFGEPDVYTAVQNVVEDWENYTPGRSDVDKATVVRAIAMDQDGNYSDVMTATYFVNLEQYQDKDVICLTADPEDLFGDDGIHVTGAEYDEWYLSGMEGEKPTPNYEHGGREWEIEGDFLLLEAGEEVLQQPVGIRIQGASSRGLAMKRFSIYSRAQYGGSSVFEEELISGKNPHSTTLVYDTSDAIAQSLSEGRNVGCQDFRRAVLFLNGEYWNSVLVQEKYNKYYLSDRYGVDQDNLILIKNHSVTIGEEDDQERWEALFQWWPDTEKTDLENYKEFSERVDIQSMVDFLCVNAYLCNMDVNKNQNHVMWRTREDDGTEYGDGRWRWLLYDMDSITWTDPEGYGCSSVAQINTFSQVMESTGQALNEYPLFRAMKQNEIFRKQFVLTFMDLANTNYSLKAVSEKLEEWGKDLDWNDGFFRERFDYIVPYMAQEFDLTGYLEEITLETDDPEAGYIQVNTCVPDLSAGSWTGTYYTDYPITVTAVASDGYRFAGWEGSMESSAKSLTVNLGVGSAHLKAVFEKE